MKFYNRIEEQKEIEYFITHMPSMLVITGRRRVGKTELIKKIKNQLYFFVDSKKSEKLLIEEFFSEIKNKFRVDELINVESWDNFFKLLFDISKKESVIASFDEFQRFLRINPSPIYQLQKHWDLSKDASRIALIFSGSSIGMMKRIFAENKAPLFKRAQNILYVQPFNFEIVHKILEDLGIRDIEEKITIYSLFGGVVNYYALMDFYGVKSLEAIFNRLIFRIHAPLKNEVKDIFIEEFGKEHATYYSILAALAMGKNTKKEIADSVSIKETSLSPYMYDLMEILGIVRYELPFNEKATSKKGRYFLADRFFKFWFNFVFRNQSYYEIGDFTFFDRLLAKNFNAFIGGGFEELCLELIKEKKIPVPFTTVKVGKWWNRKGEEIDGVITEGNAIMFVECKWKDKVDAEQVWEELKRKSAVVQWNNQKRKEYFAIFAKSFKDKIKEADVFLFDLEDIEKLLT